MSVRYSGAGAGLILGILAAFVIVAIGLWALIRWVSSDVQQGDAPVRQTQTKNVQGK